MLQFMRFQRVGHDLATECFPGSSAGKALSAMQGRPGFHPWDGKMPWRRKRLPTPVFWPEEFHGLYSPWGRKESDTIERLSLSLVYRTTNALQCYAGFFYTTNYIIFPPS